MPTTSGAGTVSKLYLDHAVTRSLLCGGTLFRNAALETGPFLYPDDSGGAGAGGEGVGKGAEGKGKDDGDNDDGETPEDVTGLKSALAKVREERKQARLEAKQNRERFEELERKQREADDAKKRSEEEEAKKKGEFETLATTREKERDEAKAEAATLQGRVDQYATAMKAGVETRWKDLPEAVRKLGEKYHPEEDTLGRWTFLNDPDTAALVKEHADKATARGNGQDPKGGDGKPEIKSLISKQQAGFSG